VVGFRLDDHPANAIDQQRCANQVRRYGKRGPGKEARLHQSITTLPELPDFIASKPD
jgi:hypothetical protein